MSNQTAKKLHEDGVTLFRRGQLEEAFQKLQEALQNADEDSRQKAEIYNDLGVIHTQREDYEAAYEALNEAMERFTDADDRKGQGQTLGNLAATLQAEGDLERAVESYKMAATYLEEAGENNMAMYVWQAISKIRMKQGQYIAAIGAYEEGIEKMPQNSFKRKIMRQILKAPNSLLGGGGSTDEADDD
ncbi:MAG: tetratricopeptide repeat protein [Anaerolineae bacterium]|nr:tetratricopeptide repeat protein [Anaerolineae bacterium]